MGDGPVAPPRKVLIQETLFKQPSIYHLMMSIIWRYYCVNAHTTHKHTTTPNLSYWFSFSIGFLSHLQRIVENGTSSCRRIASTCTNTGIYIVFREFIFFVFCFDIVHFVLCSRFFCVNYASALIVNICGKSTQVQRIWQRLITCL